MQEHEIREAWAQLAERERRLNETVNRRTAQLDERAARFEQVAAELTARAQDVDEAEAKLDARAERIAAAEEALRERERVVRDVEARGERVTQREFELD